MIRKLKSGQYRLYSRNKSPMTGLRRNLGTFPTRKAAEEHERDGEYVTLTTKPQSDSTVRRD